MPRSGASAMTTSTSKKADLYVDMAEGAVDESGMTMTSAMLTSCCV
jgi:hypothetical protein